MDKERGEVAGKNRITDRYGEGKGKVDIWVSKKDKRWKQLTNNSGQSFLTCHTTIHLCLLLALTIRNTQLHYSEEGASCSTAQQQRRRWENCKAHSREQWTIDGQSSANSLTKHSYTSWILSRQRCERYATASFRNTHTSWQFEWT